MEADVYRVRQEELLHILKTLATLRVPSARDGGSDSELLFTQRRQADPIADKVNDASSSGHLLGFYPLLLDLSFMKHSIPSMWICPSEHHRIFSDVGQGKVDGSSTVDESGLIEVTSKDLAKRCLELIGLERSIN